MPNYVDNKHHRSNLNSRQYFCSSNRFSKLPKGSFYVCLSVLVKYFVLQLRIPGPTMLGCFQFSVLLKMCPKSFHRACITFVDRGTVFVILYSLTFETLSVHFILRIERRCLRCTISSFSRTCCGTAQLLQLYSSTETTWAS